MTLGHLTLTLVMRGQNLKVTPRTSDVNTGSEKSTVKSYIGAFDINTGNERSTLEGGVWRVVDVRRQLLLFNGFP